MATHKSKPESYELLSDAIGCSPAEIIYIDDSQLNIRSAESVGVNAFQYQSNEQIEALLQELV